MMLDENDNGALGMAAILNEYAKSLQRIFFQFISSTDKDCRVDSPPEAEVLALKAGRVMKVSQFVAFAREFSIIPGLMSCVEVTEIFHNVLRNSKENAMNYTDFAAGIVQCALMVFSGKEWDDAYPRVSEKLRLLLFWMDQGSRIFKCNGDKLAQIIKTAGKCQNNHTEQKLGHQKFPISCSYYLPHIEGLDLELEALFESYCTYGDRLNAGTTATLSSFKFCKILRDCGLMDESGLTSAEIDVIFHQTANAYSARNTNTSGTRKINYDTFYLALARVGQRFFPEASSLSAALYDLLMQFIVPAMARMGNGLRIASARKPGVYYHRAALIENSINAALWREHWHRISALENELRSPKVVQLFCRTDHRPKRAADTENESLALGTSNPNTREEKDVQIQRTDRPLSPTVRQALSSVVESQKILAEVDKNQENCSRQCEVEAPNADRIAGVRQKIDHDLQQISCLGSANGCVVGDEKSPPPNQIRHAIVEDLQNMLSEMNFATWKDVTDEQVLNSAQDVDFPTCERDLNAAMGLLTNKLETLKHYDGASHGNPSPRHRYREVHDLSKILHGMKNEIEETQAPSIIPHSNVSPHGLPVPTQLIQDDDSPRSRRIGVGSPTSDPHDLHASNRIFPKSPLRTFPKSLRQYDERFQDMTSNTSPPIPERQLPLNHPHIPEIVQPLRRKSRIPHTMNEGMAITNSNEGQIQLSNDASKWIDDITSKEILRCHIPLHVDTSYLRDINAFRNSSTATVSIQATYSDTPRCAYTAPSNIVISLEIGDPFSIIALHYVDNSLYKTIQRAFSLPVSYQEYAEWLVQRFKECTLDYRLSLRAVLVLTSWENGKLSLFERCQKKDSEPKEILGLACAIDSVRGGNRDV